MHKHIQQASCKTLHNHCLIIYDYCNLHIHSHPYVQSRFTLFVYDTTYVKVSLETWSETLCLFTSNIRFSFTKSPNKVKLCIHLN